MDVGEIFGNALRFPFSDYRKLLIVGVIYLFVNLSKILTSFGFMNDSFLMILDVISVLIVLLVVGYGVSVLRSSISLDDEIPDFDWASNFVDGIKFAVIQVVYTCIPAIITFIIAIALGYGPISKILTPGNIDKFSALSSTASSRDILNIVPQEVWSFLFTAIIITFVVGLILFIIFYFFNIIATCRFAKYNSLGEAFSFVKIFDDMKEIGIINLIIFLILMIIVYAIISLILLFITRIPFVGAIIAYSIGYSFSLLFRFRAMGLLYSDL